MVCVINKPQFLKTRENYNRLEQQIKKVDTSNHLKKPGESEKPNE